MAALTDRQNNYRILMIALFWTFLIVGALFYIVPNNIIDLFNTVSGKIGYFQATPQSMEKFYIDLAVAYMACVTTIAYLIQKDVKRNLNLTPVLIVGKATSSLISLVSFMAYQRSLLYFSNFVVDGSIVIIVLAFYLPAKSESRT
ncbi:MAG: hypothetical protein M1491_00790 [Deltaproteobacteria bacterium]|nr:hypothetical protein [Deltaproteobacteria bacterium]MCL5277356.1 hypothetical protein [Deltaproteobacteria bacterium]